MCRNIRPLHNFEPPATAEEIHAAAVQFVRKICGTTRPSKANKKLFESAIDEIATTVTDLLGGMLTTAPPRNRERIAAPARARAARRFAKN